MKPLLFFLFLLAFSSGYSINVGHVESRLGREDACNISSSGNKPNPVWFKFLKKKAERKRVIAAALAFPLPFGILGIHRIYLGTRPFVPLVYVGTLGGCAGILPMIDFVTLLCNKDIERFKNNPNIFMWVDNEKEKK